MCIIEEAKKSIAKKLEVDFIWNRKKGKQFSRHNSIPENVVHYFNMTIPDILVEIIDFKTCS